MTIFSRVYLFTLIFGLCTSAQGSTPTEVWEITPVGLLTRSSVTAQVTRNGDQYFVDGQTLLELGLTDESILPNRQYALNDIGTAEVHKTLNSIKLHIGPRFLPPTRFSLGSTDHELKEAPLAEQALVLNYEAQATTENRGGAGLLLESSYYIAGRYRLDIAGSISKNHYQGNSWYRLGTTLSYDDPLRSTSWSIGDAVANNGSGVNPVSFAGIQIKTDYAMTPGFVFQPATELNGSASMQSILEVYLDNRKVISNLIPAGPFSIGNIIPQVGANNARVVLRDALGQEQVITQSLLGAPGLIKPGFDNYSVQTGSLRTGSSQYEGWFVSGYYARGINHTLTVEMNADASTKSKNFTAVKHVGVGLVTATPLGSLSLRGRVGTGSTATFGYANGWRDGEMAATFNVSATKNSSDYKVLGFRGIPSRTSGTMQGSFQWARTKNISFYALKNDNNSSSGLTLTLAPDVQYKPTYSISLDRTSFFAQKRTALIFSMSMPFGTESKTRNQFINGSTRYQDSRFVRKSLSYSNTGRTQLGTNYLLNADSSYGKERVEATITHLSNNGESSLSMASHAGDTDVRGRARGSIVIDADGVNKSRWVSGGYAKIRSDIPNVTILVNGTPLGKTDGDGLGLIPVTSAYLSTKIGLDPNFEETIDMQPLDIVVRPKGGATVEFKKVFGTMLSIPGVTMGLLDINGKTYPITDRGVYLELAPGQYIGSITGGHVVNFVIPDPKGQLLQNVTAH